MTTLRITVPRKWRITFTLDADGALTITVEPLGLIAVVRSTNRGNRWSGLTGHRPSLAQIVPQT